MNLWRSRGPLALIIGICSLMVFVWPMTAAAQACPAQGRQITHARGPLLVIYDDDLNAFETLTLKPPFVFTATVLACADAYYVIKYKGKELNVRKMEVLLSQDMRDLPPCPCPKLGSVNPDTDVAAGNQANGGGICKIPPRCPKP